MSNHESNLGEQALDKLAEVAIASQLDQSDKVDVELHTDPLELVQGKVNSAAITAKGAVMKRDLRVEILEAKTEAVEIDPMKAIAGQIELTQPTRAQAKILLTEADLNRALRSDYIRKKMQGLTIDVEGKPTLIDIQDVEIKLLNKGRMALDVCMAERGDSEMKKFSAIAKPVLKEEGQRIDLEILSAEGNNLYLEFVTGLFDEILELLDLRNFELEGMKLSLTDFIIQEGVLLLRANSIIEKLPSN